MRIENHSHPPYHLSAVVRPLFVHSQQELTAIHLPSTPVSQGEPQIGSTTN